VRGAGPRFNGMTKRRNQSKEGIEGLRRKTEEEGSAQVSRKNEGKRKESKAKAKEGMSARSLSMPSVFLRKSRIHREQVGVGHGRNGQEPAIFVLRLLFASLMVVMMCFKTRRGCIASRSCRSLALCRERRRRGRRSETMSRGIHVRVLHGGRCGIHPCPIRRLCGSRQTIWLQQTGGTTIGRRVRKISSGHLLVMMVPILRGLVDRGSSKASDSRDRALVSGRGRVWMAGRCHWTSIRVIRRGIRGHGM